ncbi:hypothetical protein LTR66_002183 [Elasticomyces elasticus]|nr:hypothetical protein LTR66_002183 [Elasticomyces elasticus]
MYRERSWRPLLYALYSALAAITLRIIYRIVEFSRGTSSSNPIPFHEEYAYALDAFPMMLAILVLVVWHPDRTLVGPDSEFLRLSRAEKKAIKLGKREMKAREKEKKRSLKTAKSGDWSSVYRLTDQLNVRNKERANYFKLGEAAEVSGDERVFRRYGEQTQHPT